MTSTTFAVGTRIEAVRYAALSVATNVPNAAQCILGRRIAIETAEENMLQVLAHRLCHRKPEIACRPDDDDAAESRLAMLQRMVGEAASVTTARVRSDATRIHTYARQSSMANWTGGSSQEKFAKTVADIDVNPKE